MSSCEAAAGAALKTELEKPLNLGAVGGGPLLFDPEFLSEPINPFADDISTSPNFYDAL